MLTSFGRFRSYASLKAKRALRGGGKPRSSGRGRGRGAKPHAAPRTGVAAPTLSDVRSFEYVPPSRCSGSARQRGVGGQGLGVGGTLTP